MSFRENYLRNSETRKVTLSFRTQCSIYHNFSKRGRSRSDQSPRSASGHRSARFPAYTNPQQMYTPIETGT